MRTVRRTGMVTAGVLLLAACTHNATQALTLRSQPSSPSPIATPSASPSASPVVPRLQVPRGSSGRTRMATLPVTTGTVAESVLGSSTLATAVERSPAGPGQGPVTVVVFDASRTRLVLHAGASDPVAGRTWVHGPTLSRQERSRTVAVFNSGFKRKDSHGGWLSGGRTVVPLVRGAASVVTYADGSTDIGAWGTEVPAPGRQVESVRQNLTLLIDAGMPRLTRPRNQAQLNAWWGHAFKDAPLVSRSALGVTADGRLVYAGGTHITVAALDAALLSRGVVRAMELDINAPLVRGFLFARPAVVRTPAGTVAGPLPLVVGQTQGPRYSTTSLTAPHCTYVTSCPRDFFAVELR